MPIAKSEEKLDSNEGIFFSKQLEHVKKKLYETKYPHLKARDIFPVSFDAPNHVETISYRSLNQFGMAAILSNYATDLPMVELTGAEYVNRVRSLGAAYGFSINDVRAAIANNMPLKQTKANIAKRAIMELENRIAFRGDESHQLTGLFNHPNVPRETVANGGSGTAWSTKTPDQILADMNGAASKITEDTNMVETPDTMVLPVRQYNQIANTKSSADDSKSILKVFLENQDYIKQVVQLNENKGAGTGGVDAMFTYCRDPEKVTLEIPQDFEQFKEKEEGLSWKVPCHARCGGLIIPYPMSFLISEGI